MTALWEAGQTEGSWAGVPWVKFFCFFLFTKRRPWLHFWAWGYPSPNPLAQGERALLEGEVRRNVGRVGVAGAFLGR